MPRTPSGLIDASDNNLCPTCYPIIRQIELHDAEHWNVIRRAHGFRRMSTVRGSAKKHERDDADLSPESCVLCHAIVMVLESIPQSIKVDTTLTIHGPEYHLQYPEELFPAVEYEVFCSPREAENTQWRRFGTVKVGKIISHAQLRDDAPQASWHDRAVPSVMDTEVVLEWFDRSNRRDCPPSVSTQRTEDGNDTRLRLIDCKAACLVTQRMPCRYLALSYVWGKLDPAWLSLKKDNRIQLSKQGALRQVQPANLRLPAAISECMKLATALGFDFLWVDALCITQDDPQEKAHLIDKMHEVYQAAFATIILTHCKSSDSSVPGVSPRPSRNWTSSRSAVVGTFEFKFVPTAEPLGDLINSGPWSSRAWTFQEECMSQRRLYVTPLEMFLCDGNRIYREGNSASFEVDTVSSEGYDLLQTALSSPLLNSHTEYVRGVQAYMKRKLTFPGDILNAFTGVYEVFNSASKIPLPIQDTHGNPLNTFPECLMWASLHRQAQREVSNLEIPTWSWARALSEVGFENAVTPLPLQLFLRTAQQMIGPFGAAIAQHLAKADGQTRLDGPSQTSGVPLNSSFVADLLHRPQSGWPELQQHLLHDFWCEPGRTTALRLAEFQYCRPGTLGFWAPMVLTFERPLVKILGRQPSTRQGTASQQHAHGQSSGWYRPDPNDGREPSELVVLGFAEEDRLEWRGLLCLATRTDADGISQRVGFAKIFWCRSSWLERVEDGDVEVHWRCMRLV